MRGFRNLIILLALPLAPCAAFSQETQDNPVPPASDRAEVKPAAEIGIDQPAASDASESKPPDGAPEVSQDVQVSPDQMPQESSDEAADEKGESGGFFSDFPIKFSSTLRMGYDTNIFYTKIDPIASLYTSLGGAMDYEFGGKRLKFDVGLSGGISYYYSRPGDKQEYNGSFSFNLEYKVAPRILFHLTNLSQYLPQPSYALVGGSSQYSYDYIYQNTKIDVSAQVSPKLSAVTAYNFLSFYYLKPTVNETQGYITQTVSESLQFLMQPKTTLVLELRAGPTSYFVEGQSSFAEYLLVGINQTFSPRLKLTMRGGAEYITNQNPISGESSNLGPFFESHLSYNFGPASTLTWDIRYGTESAGVANINQSQTFRTGLSAVHAFTPRIALSLGINYTNNNYQQEYPTPDYTRNTTDVSLGARFQINRQLSVELGYSYTTVFSQEAPGLDYTRQVIFVGGAFAL